MQKQASKPRKPRATKAKASETAQATETSESVANLPAIATQAENTESASDTQAQSEPTKAEQISAARDNAARVFAKLSDAVSIPIKSTLAFKLNRDLQPHAIGRKPSARQAAAIIIAIVASGSKLENGATFKRAFNVGTLSYAIENGCAADFLRAGLATYDRESETFTVANASEIRAQLGKAIAGFNI
jgi:hypothetical protein